MAAAILSSTTTLSIYSSMYVTFCVSSFNGRATISDRLSPLRLVISSPPLSYSVMYWYMCRLNANHRHCVVNKDCRLSPSTPPSSLWFLLLTYIAPGVGIHRTCRSHTLRPPEFNTHPVPRIFALRGRAVSSKLRLIYEYYRLNMSPHTDSPQ